MISKSKIYLSRKVARLLGIATGILLCVVGMSLLWGEYGPRYLQNTNIPNETVIRSIETPGETVPKEACEKYQVESNQPRKIIIDKIGVDGCIQRVGLDQNNAIAVPTNIHLAGWFVNSVVPGDDGNSIIDGHVLGRYNDAIFVRLYELQAGDRISVQFGDRSIKTFRVVEAKSYSIDETGQKMFEQLPEVERQLTLITCTGKYNSQTQTYDKRLVVRASYVEQ